MLGHVKELFIKGETSMMTIGYERKERAAIEKDVRIVPMLTLEQFCYEK